MRNRFTNRLVLGLFLSFSVLMIAMPSWAALDWSRFSVLTPAGPREAEPNVLRSLNFLTYTEHELHSKEWNLWRTAKDYGTSMPSLQSTNNNELILTRPGQKIIVPNKVGYLYFIKKEIESLDAIISRYQKDPERARKLKEKVVEMNDLPGSALIAPYELRSGEYVLLPGVSITFDTYQFPFRDPGWTRISSGFGMRFHPILKYTRRHDGVDLPKPFGTPVYASRSGRVIYVGWKEGYGNEVEVRHSDGWSTVYGHLSKMNVVVGQWVQKGISLLGKVGSTGLSTGPHLHFEVRRPNGEPYNPRLKIGRR